MINEYEDTDLLWGVYGQGLLQAAYLPVDAVGNVLLLECDSIDQAQKALNRLPWPPASSASNSRNSFPYPNWKEKRRGCSALMLLNRDRPKMQVFHPSIHLHEPL